MLDRDLPVVERFVKIRQATLDLCAPLTVEDCVPQPIVDVSPPKWHLAHVTWFFETFLLKPYAPNYREFHPQYGYLFNSYYETVGNRTYRGDRGFMTRPTLDEVKQYREFVEKQLLAFLDSNAPRDDRFYDLLELGLQHEQQHQELLVTDLKYILGINPLFPVYRESETIARPKASAIAPLQFLTVPEGVYDIGFDGKSSGKQPGDRPETNLRADSFCSDFCFDNELGRHRVYLHEFEIADRPITNREYLAFTNDGGYDRFGFWLDAGWGWVQRTGRRSPLYWHEIDGEWWEWTLSGLRKLALDEPVVHVSYYEADAFARYSGARLPTEFEWEIACKTFQPEVPKTANFVESLAFHPRSTPGTKPERSSNGSASAIAGQTQANQRTDAPPPARDLKFYGDLWEWTASAYLPYPYFQTAEGAVGEYNGKFMSDQWVLRGGSCATPRDHIRATYRNFFPADKQWQFSGIRLARHSQSPHS